MGLAAAFVAGVAAVLMGLLVLLVGFADVDLVPSGSSVRQEGKKAYRAAVAPDVNERRGIRRADRYPHDCSKEKCVALTFDDGPVKGTGRVLDALARAKAKATFFVLGSMAAEEPGMLRRAAAEGHEIGNHTWDHADLSRLPAARIRREIRRTGDLVTRLTGVTPRLLRPPYGASNRRVVRAARSFGLPQIMWAVDPQDWRDHRPASVTHRVLKDVQPGHIVLMHDIQPGTVKAVPRVLKTLKRRGYVFVTVSELLAGELTLPGNEYRERPETEEDV
ncbi:hypothetical protein GCM10010468_36100 [Actinocorallia longicatena]|uniref:NodB homology domain-containing protein n=1 Tax=Actinocorallia longicatena TaxID=111803 RepID=A0ABP6QB62_9ACTN